MHPSKVLRVGIVGCGEITQVAHIPTLGFLSDFFQITYLCDVSENALSHCKNKVIGGVPKATTDPQLLASSPDVDVVFVLSSTESHTSHVLLGLNHNKYVFVEKPMCLTYRDADLIIDAEKRSQGRVFVGYMRRYATAFLDAVEEIGHDKILYARVRDIIGPNASFVDQSGTFPKKFTDFKAEDTIEKNAKMEAIFRQAFDKEIAVADTEQSRRMLNVLGGLGSHDLSVMREVLGKPVGVLGASLGFPFWNVLFQYPGFAVSYESGIDNIPRFDAHIEVYGLNKSVRVQYDSPYVKGLPTTMHILENVDGTFKETIVRRSYEDAYTLEMKELYETLIGGKTIKTTAADAREELDIFKMILKKGEYVEAKNGFQNHN